LCQIHKAAPRVSFLTHVDGNWGAGKSSLLNFLDDKLKDTFLVVRFNAWQQSRIGPPWWTLLTATRHAIANELGWWGKRRLRVSETYARTQRAGALYSLALLILVVTISVVAYALWPHKSTIASWSETAKAVTTIAAAVAVFWTGAQVAARFLLWDSARGAELLEKSGTSPLREIYSQFSWLIGKTPPSRQPSPSDQSPRPGQPPPPVHPSPPDKPPPRDKSPRPVIFFIDDLDRCDSAYVIDFLDSVQTIVRDAATPSGKNGHAAMFLVAADGAWLRTSYEGAYKDFRDAIGQPGRPLGYLFLDKIFQLSLTLPTASKAAQQTLLDKLLQVPALENPEIDRQITAAKNDLDSARGDGERVRDVLRKLPEPVAVAVSGDAAKVLADPATVSRTEHKLQKFAKLLDGNPRTTKRFVNTFTVIEAIRTLETEIIDFDTLALWSIIRVRWPEVADYLQREPAAITSIINSPASAEVSEPIRATACLPELRRVVQFPEGGPLTEELIRRCSGGALGTATQST